MHFQQPFTALIIGAGQAGLAAAYHLQRAGKSFVVLEAGVVWNEGTAEAVDAVLFATGY